MVTLQQGYTQRATLSKDAVNYFDFGASVSVGLAQTAGTEKIFIQQNRGVPITTANTKDASIAIEGKYLGKGKDEAFEILEYAYDIKKNIRCKFYYNIDDTSKFIESEVAVTALNIDGDAENKRIFSATLEFSGNPVKVG